MLRLSTAVKVAWLSAWPTLFNDAVIRIYSGVIPSSADQPPQGSYIGAITRDGLSPAPGHGLNFIVRPDGIVTRTDGEVWTLTGVATGTAGWGRLAAVGDPPIFQPGSARIDFQVNPSDGNGLLVTNPALAAGLTQDVPYFNYQIPG